MRVEYTEADYLREVQLGLRRLSKRVASLDKRLERVAVMGSRMGSCLTLPPSPGGIHMETKKLTLSQLDGEWS